MRIINKILIFSFLASLCFINFSFAKEDSDCAKFAILYYSQKWTSDNWFKIVTQSRNTTKNKFSKFLTIDEQNAIIDNASLNTAMLNLKKYCCEHGDSWFQNSETCIKDKWFFNTNALDSPYLFDHLFDVIMRRLSGLTGEKNIYEYTNMTVDDKWNERRAWITNVAESTWWASPQLIIDQYVQTRAKTPPDYGYDISSKIYVAFWSLMDDDFLSYVSWEWESDESKDVATAIKNYSNRTLYDRYINACAMAEYFYSLLNVWINSDDRLITKNRVSNWICHKFVTTQIDAENSYVKLVIQKSSNLFLANYIAWYMDYLRGRSENLKSTQTEIQNKFLDIVRAVPKLIKQCVH